MRKNKVHSVSNRLMSISQPWVRPIVRGKAKTPVEFEAKLDGKIRLSGPKLGIPLLDAKTDKKQEHKDNTDRIEVERFFSQSKRCYGMGCIVTKLEETQLASIALSVCVSHLFRIQRRILLRLFGNYSDMWNISEGKSKSGLISRH